MNADAVAQAVKVAWKALLILAEFVYSLWGS